MSTQLANKFGSQALVQVDSQIMSHASVVSIKHSPLEGSKKFPYQADQQVKLLHLQAEVESLLQQLQFMKQQRTSVTSVDSRPD